MREILFRGKPKSNNEYYCFSQIWKDNCKSGFVYGLLIISKNKCFICVSAVGKKLNCCINNSTVSIIEVLPETVGQYTGLTDKNSKKIFEGDIVKDKSLPIVCGIGVIEFGNYEMRMDSSLINDDYSYHIGFYVKWIGIVDYRKDLAFWHNKVEVIGNIHDNPELLKEADDDKLKSN